MAQRNRGRRIIRQKPDRKANRVIFIRSLILMGVFGCLAFLPLFVKLWQLQITDHDYYQELAVKQQTRDSTVTANRGTIYDSNGTVLAMSATVYNIQLSPNDLRETQETYREKVEKAQESGGSLPDYPEPTNEFIASNLAAILDLDEADILRRLEKDSQYEMIKWRVDTEESDAVQEFITENHLSHGIYLMPTSKRYYPKNSLAAQVIGWVNPNMDNVGAYGLEAQFEDELSGQTGRIVTAKDGNGTELLYRFEDYYDAMDGNDLTLTLDATIQSFCESVVQEGVEQFEVQNGAFCLVMDPNTGAILAWANSPTYDLNDPWEISDPVLLQYIEDVKSGAYTEEEAYQKALAEGCTQEEAYDKAVDAAVGNAQLSQWRNKAINDTYEPGSTFKSMVLAAALEEGVVTESDHFYCSGSVMVEGYGSPIKCSNRSGHKDQDLATAVANSCNPAFIEIGQRLGAEKFYDYLEDFGFLGPTNIDVQGESASGGQIIWSRESFTNVDLAVASFGQRFNVTPLQLITAASAVINGGHLMQPYVVSQISDSDGNVLQHTEPTEVRQVVSEETSARCRAILEKVVDGGTGKNAAVEGYRIGGKTGSSETTETGRTIVSFLGFAPADDPQVVVLLAYDNPKPVSPGANVTSGGWYIGGGSMAGLKAGELLEDILDYLGVEKSYSATDDVLVPDVTGMTVEQATEALKQNNLTLRTVGEGDTITGQIPANGASIPGGSQVVVYLGVDVPTDQVQVPNVIGLTAEQAQAKLAEVDLYLRVSGASQYGDNVVSYEQSVTAGTLVDRGSTIEVRFNDATASGEGL
ncbi:penicillin-binding transpeptidase domain-containing protein [Pseudoflavonifractor phocaeensis]|uniref:penicillin-binding transpeptidase domain-containing protein n=1 Tax=Pseudoflavonifractor phocaeensis TaxID=1870988 RepID=UPI00195EBC45|nr:penicillin-binding transpeptidase domain-containing protein [Pseudoflavonifractor phocaeensis]MBM6925131.1 PASTA domain-containing protein [Pseudoflavonifractor phocaeensis]